ncbi:nucleotidyltransferase domain-containing protein [Candidatus Woesearchaeota archaeon]|nr:nucleotidyltransferase domain-containing protein [Candidatus Woesearchaeota archaeon]
MEDLTKLIGEFPQIISLIQFGSSISGDTYAGSDIDVLFVVNENKKEAEEELRKKLGWEYQMHVYTKEEFLESINKREPLALSIVHTGKVWFGEEFISHLRKILPNDYTAKRYMLNSFAALGRGISDLMQGMSYDAVNGFYHAARSSIWAALMVQEVTPPNKRIFELLEEGEIKQKYREILKFRSHIPDTETDFDLDKKMWKQGDVNEFTELLVKTNFLVKTNYQKVCGENYMDCFEVLELLREKYSPPKFYYLMLSVDWEKMLPYYHIMLSYEQRWLSLDIDAHTGKVIEKEIKAKDSLKERREPRTM